MTVVAIDGPAGAGKSTVARLVAAAIGATYVDTGAIYRAVALACLERGVEVTHSEAAAAVAADVDISFVSGVLYLDGRDVSARIRAADVTAAVPLVASHPQVRDALVGLQRRAAAAGNVVMEGRDIGSNVVPDAPVKIFLTASIDERARRRWLETPGASEADLETIKAAIIERDRHDSARAAAPLVQAPDAHVVDTSTLSIDEVVGRIVAIVEEVTGGGH